MERRVSTFESKLRITLGFFCVNVVLFQHVNVDANLSENRNTHAIVFLFYDFYCLLFS